MGFLPYHQHQRMPSCFRNRLGIRCFSEGYLPARANALYVVKWLFFLAELNHTPSGVFALLIDL